MNLEKMLNNRIKDLKPSGIRRFFDMASEYKDIVSLGVGEPDFDTPWHIRQEAIKALQEGRTFYTANAGLKELREEVCIFTEGRHGVKYDPMHECVITVGGSEAVDISMRVLLNPGDEVIICDPGYVSYVPAVTMADGVPVILPLKEENQFRITPEDLEAVITPKTKALILCSPSNPTGSVYSKEELAGLVAVLAKHPQVIVIADEIYEHINYIGKHQSIAQFPEMKDRTVIVNGVSKAYAMTGWRIGFIAGPEWIVKASNKLQGQYTSGPCSVSQKAAEAAYTGTQAPVEEMRKAFERRRDLIVKLAKEVPGFEVNVPEGAFYLFPKCSSFFGKSAGDRKIENSDDLAMYLLEVAHVACVGGTSFGAPECIRMSYATSDENIVEAISRIKEALSKLV